MTASKIVLSSLTHIRPITCAASYNTRLVPHPPDLVKWVKREGGFVHQAVKISPQQNEANGLGLVASQDIPKGSLLIALPDHIPLRFESDSGDGADSVLANLARQVPEELWAMKLGLKLLQERAKVGSFWWPYISNLPETYSVPIFFQGEDIKNLQYAPLLYQVNKRCRFLLDFEKEVGHALVSLKPNDHPFEGQDVGASSLGWAMSAVSSRAFRLHGKKLSDGTRNKIPMMLPLIDMCNHSFNPNAQILQEEDAKNTELLIKVVAETEIKENDSLLLNYGCLSNDLFLLDYGFVIPSNPYDTIELKYDEALMDAASMAAGVSSPNFSSPAAWQQQILSQLNLIGEAPIVKVSLGGPEFIDGRLLAAIRVLLASDLETVQKHDLDTLKSISAEAPLGIANEVAAFRTIIALCVIALEHFPTKIMEDESLLKQGVSASTDLAIRFRIHKKSMIIDVMRNLSRRVKLLLSKETAATEA
ncbi:Histone-lysine N-methyltransferase [Melia azedarach]|uniref:Histone-lysine N-methyltransferase n=1 Tax=Melia azedarach TaxID=155640 RepID=A0ACC1XFJ2_MELAZ|nr:Histone-lysine N-methyltransferase [Melia azedarach]